MVSYLIVNRIVENLFLFLFIWCWFSFFTGISLPYKATLDLYKMIVNELPPTPSKFHYIFNLRDLSRVCQGLLLTTPDRFQKVQGFVRVWHNECLRVFYDRLINAEDKVHVQVRFCNLSEMWIRLTEDKNDLKMFLLSSKRIQRFWKNIVTFSECFPLPIFIDLYWFLFYNYRNWSNLFLRTISKSM